MGLDIVVIDNGPVPKNPFGHSAIGVTGEGIFSFGNDTPLGSSATDYIRKQSMRRNSTAFIIHTTPKQDAAALRYLSQFRDKNGVNAFPDNCTSRVEHALAAAGIKLIDPLTMLPPAPFPASLERALIFAGFGGQSIPQNGIVPSGLRTFNPR